MTERRKHEPSKTELETMDLLKFNKALDKRIMGSMRADHLNGSTKQVFYGQEERVTPLQMSARHVLTK
jgi:hypothetical protein